MTRRCPRLDRRPLAALLTLALLGATGPAAAQALTPAFTYQGELRLSSGPATGNYDLQFRLFNAVSGGSQLGPTVTQTNVAVSGGLLSVPLDFGPAQFAGDRQWLEIAIRPAGSGSYETLSPRTEVTAAPYAWGAAAALANSVTSTSIVDGTIGTADINATQVQRRVTGSCPTGQYVRVIAQDGTVTCGTDANAGGTVTSVATGAGLTGGPITATGTIAVAAGGIGTTEINATQVQRRVTGSCPTGQYVRVVAQDGTVTCGTDATGSGTVTSIATGAGLTGGPITTTGTIAVAAGGIGTTEINATQVQRRVTGTCSGTNYVQQVNQDGTVACGPAPAASGWSLTGNAGTNPAANFIGTTDNQPFVVRTANARSLRIEPSSNTFGTPALPITTNTIGGSHANEVTPGVRGATIAGGGVPSGDSDPDFFSENPNRVTDHYGTVGGGVNNQAGDAVGITTDRPFATVGGGWSNTASGSGSTVGGGERNTARGSSSTVGGGLVNTASGFSSTVGGGQLNTASGRGSTVGGGEENTASGADSTVGGGERNTASGESSTVGGGELNTASGADSTVGGGYGNTARGFTSTVSGGIANCAGGDYSWAGGRRAKIRPATNPGVSGPCSGLTYPGGSGDQGTFVWADSQDANFVSTGLNQFLVRADGGFGFNTNTIPEGIEAVFQGRTGPNGNVDLYLKPAAHGRGINLAMLPGAGAAAFYISQYDGTTFVDRILLASNGDFSVTAQAFKPGGGSWAVPSDARLKSDVAPLAGTLDKLLALRGVEYAYRPEATPKSMYLPGRQVGFIAQEVERVFPDWVSETDEGYKIVGPRGFEALTVEALRELRAESAAIDGGQSARITALEAENAALRARLERLESLIVDRASEER